MGGIGIGREVKGRVIVGLLSGQRVVLGGWAVVPVGEEDEEEEGEEEEGEEGEEGEEEAEDETRRD